MEDIAEKSLVLDIFSIIKTVIFAVFCALIINNFIIINAVVPSGSMEKTIMVGDRIIANRLAFIFDNIDRGDIVVFRNPDDYNELLVKRVIGLPNDNINIIKGKIYINGELYEEDYINVDDEFYSGEFNVPEDSYFMMGDNRRYSIDSRYWDNSYVKRDQIIGKALFRYFPRIGILK